MRFSFQRFTLILLLVSRLIFGEFASAMPDHGVAHADHQTSSQTCGEHQHDDSCCKSACSCPCLHFSALTAAPPVTQALLQEAHTQVPVAGATPGHSNRLLRPPA